MIEIVGNFISEVMVGLVGGAVVSLIIYGRGYFQRRALMKKYPLAGEYITKYEDIENGQKVLTTAPATLRQKGRKLTGETQFGTQKWLIEAEISDMGNIYGVYRAENPNDRGVGNLFLSIDTDLAMHGIWSGYDEMNDTISSGKYTFKPVNKDVKIVNTIKKHWSQILKISDGELGRNYISNEDLSAMQSSEKYITKVALQGEKVIGFAIGKMVAFGELAEMLRISSQEIPRFLSLDDKIGYISVVAVGRNSQGAGVGFKLTSTLTQELESNGAEGFCSTAWKSDGHINIASILKQLGLEEGLEIEKYWYEDSVKNGYDCPNCGNPCTCSAVLFWK